MACLWYANLCYYSSQIVIKKAIKRGMCVKVEDRRREGREWSGGERRRAEGSGVERKGEEGGWTGAERSGMECGGGVKCEKDHRRKRRDQGSASKKKKK
jgi:hypothetical protein